MYRSFLNVILLMPVLFISSNVLASTCVPSVSPQNVCLNASNNTCSPVGMTVLDGNEQNIIACLNDGTGTLRWSAMATSNVSIPSGAIMAFDLASCPSGWNTANGTNGTVDLRGVFIRGLDSGRGLDPYTPSPRPLGSYQSDAFQGHWHGLYDDAVFGMGGGGSSMDIDAGGANNGFGSNTAVKDPVSDGVNGSPRTSTETRPANVALVYCQKQ